MTERLLGLLIEFDEMGFAPTTVCADPEGFAVRWKEQLCEEIKMLVSDNNYLRKRLEEVCESIMAGIKIDLSSFDEIEKSATATADKIGAFGKVVLK